MTDIEKVFDARHVDLRAILDAEYERGVDDGRSAAHLELANDQLWKVNEAIKKEKDALAKKVADAFLPLSEVLDLWLGDSW